MFMCLQLLKRNSNDTQDLDMLVQYTSTWRLYKAPLFSHTRNVFSQEERKLRGHLITIYSFLTRGSEGPCTDLFSLVARDRT